MGHFVYKYVLNKEIIYVGKSDVDVFKRINAHGKKGDNIPSEAWPEINKADVYFAECANNMMSDVIESALINKYHPKYNRAKQNLWAGLQFIEPPWILYQDKREIEKLKKEIEKLKIVLKKVNDQRHFYKASNVLYIDKNRELLQRVHQIENAKKEYSFFTCKNCYDTERTFLDNTVKGKTYKELIEDYRAGEMFYYTSQSTDLVGNIECIKHIYVSTYGFLEFDFHHALHNSVSGSILFDRQEKTLHNWNILRQWQLKGSNIYYPEYLKP